MSDLLNYFKNIRNLTKRFIFQIIWFFNHYYYYIIINYIFFVNIIILGNQTIKSAAINIKNSSYAVYQTTDFGLATKI